MRNKPSQNDVRTMFGLPPAPPRVSAGGGYDLRVTWGIGTREGLRGARAAAGGPYPLAPGTTAVNINHNLKSAMPHSPGACPARGYPVSVRRSPLALPVAPGGVGERPGGTATITALNIVHKVGCLVLGQRNVSRKLNG
jgi:hypothetical protein